MTPDRVSAEHHAIARAGILANNPLETPHSLKMAAVARTRIVAPPAVVTVQFCPANRSELLAMRLITWAYTAMPTRTKPAWLNGR